MKISAIGNNGKPVDWWFLYKIPSKSNASDGSTPPGTNYIYIDPKNGKKVLSLSQNLITDLNDGAVANTLNQIYDATTTDMKDMGWFIYNDENPINGQTSYVRGHTKGVLCFNEESAFWLIHSAPKLVPKGKYTYPNNAIDFAQTFLCISLTSDTAKKVAEQMFVAQQPNVCLASDAPSWLVDPNDARASLLKNMITANTAQYADYISFKSVGGESFKSIAKNMYWDTPGDDDFYNDLVGPVLTESIEVETWGRTTKVPGRLQKDGVHTVTAMKTVDLEPLGIDPSYVWSESSDHAKLCISDAGEKNHFVCVGDINFTISQEKRSGGTVAFMNEELWTSLNEILKDTVTRTSTDQRKKMARKKKNENTPKGKNSSSTKKKGKKSGGGK